MANTSSLKGMRVFVTGVTGLVGGFVAEQLLESGAQVIALVRDDVVGSYFDNLRQRCTVVHGDIEDFNTMLRIVNEYQIEGIIHLAAQTQVRVAHEHPLPTFRSNIAGTWNLLEAARQCSKFLRFFVTASSDKAYGEAITPQYDENHPLRAVYPYDVSKACSDLLAISYAKTYKLPVSVTRCGNFFGPGDLNWDRLIPHVILSLRQNKAPVIRSNGKLVRDYFFVKDGAHAYLHLANKIVENPGKFAGESYNFSYGAQHSVLDIVQLVSKMMGKDIKPDIRNEASGEIQFQSLSPDKAKRDLSWQPRYNLDSGLRETIDWYLKSEL